MSNSYADLTTFKARYMPDDTSTGRDASIEAIIEAVSREIDNWTARRFWSTSDDETRYFTAATPISVYPDEDIISITTLKTDDDNDGVYENTWSAADYITFPVNKSPLTWISSSGRGALLRFPCYQSAVQVVGKFGYCDIADVPKPVVEACYLQSHRIFKRMEAPFGVIGGNEMGTPVIITKLDGDVMQLINPYKRLEYA